MSRPRDLVKGTLGLLILRTLELEPRHGVAIADRIAQITRGDIPGEGRVARPRPSSPRAGGRDCRRVDGFGRRPAHEVVPADRGGTPPAGRQRNATGPGS